MHLVPSVPFRWNSVTDSAPISVKVLGSSILENHYEMVKVTEVIHCTNMTR